MKKILALIIAAVMIFALASCGKDSGGTSGESTPATTNEPAGTSTDSSPASDTESAPASSGTENVSPASSVATDGSKLGELQVVNEQDKLKINGLIIATGSGHHDYPTVDELVEEGYKTEGLCSEFFLDEWIEIYGDLDGGKTAYVYVLPNDEDADYTKMKASDLEKQVEALEYEIYDGLVFPDAENNGLMCSFYVHEELGAGLYNVFFAIGDEICYVVQLDIVPLGE